MNYRYIALISAVLVLSVTGMANALSVVSCSAMFAGGSTQNLYARQLATITGNSGTSYNSFLLVALLIILAMLMIVGVVYAVGTAFHIQGLMSFARTEALEGFGNFIIILGIGGSIGIAAAGLNFFGNLALLGSSSQQAIPQGTSAYAIYTGLCNNIQTRIVSSGIENWLGVFFDLYVANVFAASIPPTGGFDVVFKPAGLSNGVEFDPFQGGALLIQLLWDEQISYFGTSLMGMFIIDILFVVYFLFPIFLYVGIILRSFPWTRPAGGSLIALFISFYIVFPAMMYPFLAGPVPGAGLGICTPKGPSYSNSGTSDFGALCSAQSFINNPPVELWNIMGSNYGLLYYTNVFAFTEGIEFVGLDIIGLIIALIVSYEMVEKLGTILGAPSLQGARMLSRVV